MPDDFSLKAIIDYANGEPEATARVWSLGGESQDVDIRVDQRS